MAKVRRFICAVDFSEASVAALEYAVELASELRAAVCLLHVVQSPAYALADGEIVGGRDVAVEAGDELRRELEGLGKKYAGRGAKIDTRLLEGVPHAEIVRVAEELRADMIVMGTHGRGGLSHLLLGSVAERVVRTADCPVLTMRRPRAK